MNFACYQTNLNPIRVMGLVRRKKIFIFLFLILITNILVAQTPTVVTKSASGVISTAAIINGEITNDGGSNILERRFDWGTTPLEQSWTNWVTDNPSSDHYGSIYVTGTYFWYNLSGLQPGTTYYFRGWAKNSAGWGKGGILSFTTQSVAQNHDPTLSNSSIDPPSGDTNTDFYYYVQYYDQDGDSPERKWLVIDGGTSQATVKVMQLFSGSAANGSYRSNPIRLSAGSHRYHFEYTDGKGGSARLPSNSDQYFSGPNVTERLQQVNITFTNNSQLSGGVVEPWLYINGRDYRESSNTFNWIVGSNYSIVVVKEAHILLNTGWRKYIFTGWSNGISNNQLSYIVPNHDETLVANYKRQFRVVTRSSTGGYVTINGNRNISDCWFDSGNNVRIEAVPNANYRFDKWKSYPLRGSQIQEIYNNPLYVQDAIWVEAFFIYTNFVETNEIPYQYRIDQNYPNPFNSETIIQYQLPRESHVLIKVFNQSGHEIKTLVNAESPPGYFTVYWDGKDFNNMNVSSGIYLYTIKAGDFEESRKMILIR